MKGKRKSHPRLVKKIVIDLKAAILRRYQDLALAFSSIPPALETGPITGSHLSLNVPGGSNRAAMRDVARDLVAFVRQPGSLEEVFTVTVECYAPYRGMQEMDDVTFTRQFLMLSLMCHSSVFSSQEASQWAKAIRPREGRKVTDLGFLPGHSSEPNRLGNIYRPVHPTVQGDESVLKDFVLGSIAKSLTRAADNFFDIHVEKPAFMGGGEHVHRIEIVKQRDPSKMTHTVNEGFMGDWFAHMDDMSKHILVPIDRGTIPDLDVEKTYPDSVTLPKLEDKE